MLDVSAHEEDPHPEIATFLELVDDVRPDGVVHFADLQTLPFMRFWPNLVIYRHEPRQRDFRVSFMGTKVVGSYDGDWTNRLLSESDLEFGFESIYQDNLRIMETHGRLIAHGQLRGHTIKPGRRSRCPCVGVAMFRMFWRSCFFLEFQR